MNFNTLLNSAQFNAATKLGFKPPVYRFLASIASVAQTNSQKQTFFNIDFKMTTAHPYLNKNGITTNHTNSNIHLCKI